MIEVLYNHKSDFGNGWVSGSDRFGNIQEFCAWLYVTTNSIGPVLITEFKDDRNNS